MGYNYCGDNMNEKNFEKINDLRKKLEYCEEKSEEIKKKNSFLKVFIRSIIISLMCLFIASIMKMQNSKIIAMFIFVFVISNLLQIIFISKNQKKEIEKIKIEEIKIQAQIFALAKNDEIEKN